MSTEPRSAAPRYSFNTRAALAALSLIIATCVTACHEELPSEEYDTWEAIAFVPPGARPSGLTNSFRLDEGEPSGDAATDPYERQFLPGDTVEVFVATASILACYETLSSSCDLGWTEDGQLEARARWVLRPIVTRRPFGRGQVGCIDVGYRYPVSCGEIVVPDDAEFTVSEGGVEISSIETPVMPGWRYIY